MRLTFTVLFCLITKFISAQINPCEIDDAILVQSFSFAYDPNIITINIGETVAWINTQGYHDVNGEINSITGENFNNPENFYLPPTSGSTTDPACIGYYTFTIPGTYYYDCSIGSHATNGMIGTINVIGDNTQSINEFVAVSELIYPNPVSTILTVDLGDLNGVNTTIRLHDSSSKIVFEKQASSNLTIDVSGFAKGMYLLELIANEKVLRNQVMID
tara:strand:- start:2361 stop:3011 length:651 start_codon:yes stop_codon:yes gene_type:complete